MREDKAVGGGSYDGNGGGESPLPLFDTAHAHASMDIPVVPPAMTSATIRRHLQERLYDSVSDIVVCDGEHFLGLIRIENLLVAPADTSARELMDTNSPVVAPGTNQERAAWQAVRHEESALAVVDDNGRFLGMIPPHRLLGILLAEHDEDMARMGGFLAQGNRARATSEEPVLRRFVHRLPWLLLGLAGAIFAAGIVGKFESQLQEMLLLAFFIPSIVYLADAVGTQTETVIVRGLSLGVPLRHVVGKEILTGLMIGLTLALVAWPLVYWIWGEEKVALGVALAIFSASSVASLVAMLLPWLLDRLGIDPAFGSGPLATVIQDVLSILIYFLIVTLVVL